MGSSLYKIAFATFLMICFSGNSLAQWTQSGLTDALAWDFLQVDSRHYAATAQGLYVSTDGGASWTSSSEGLPVDKRDVRTIVANEADLFVGLQSGGAWRSTDNGQTWANVNSGVTIQFTNVSKLVHTGNNLVKATAGGMQYATKFGTNWITFNNGLEGGDVRSLIDLASQGGFFIGTPTGVYRKPPLTASAPWIKKINGLPDGPYGTVNDFETYGPYLFAATSDSGLYRSEDLGESWAGINNGIDVEAEGRHWAFTKDRHYLFVGSISGKVFRSGDQGMNWEDIGEGLPSTRIYGLYSDGTTLFAGTADNGVWTRPVSEVTAFSDMPAHVDDMQLHQNYPNPFNPSTTISFSISSAAQVSLVVTDVLGREVHRMIDGEMFQAGRYTRTLDAFGLTSGVYFYRLVANGQILNRRMQLMK